MMIVARRILPLSLLLVVCCLVPVASGSDETGTLSYHEFTDSRIYPGTVRDFWVYAPPGYDPSDPPCLMIFQDGHDYVLENGNWRAPEVLERLIGEGKIPPVLAVFVKWGHIPPENADGAYMRMNRSFEYDSLGGRYVEFLVTELLPRVAETYVFSGERNDWAIVGGSSGGVAAFNAAWERPDLFSRVFSSVGTFVAFRGGHELEFLIRKSEPKPLRVVIYDGRNDLDNQAGNWWHANQEIYTALRFNGYEVEAIWDDGTHGSKDIGPRLDEVLELLWAGYPDAPKAGRLNLDNRASEILIEGEGWERLAAGTGKIAGMASDRDGRVWALDAGGGVFFLGPKQQWQGFLNLGSGVSQMGFDREGDLLALAADGKSILDLDLKTQDAGVIKLEQKAGDLVALKDGRILLSLPSGGLLILNENGRFKSTDLKLPEFSYLAADPSGTFLAAVGNGSRFGHSAVLRGDGSIAFPQRFYHVHIPEYRDDAQVLDALFDANGLLLVPTALGIQVFGHQGRCDGIIANPDRTAIRFLCFGGADGSLLYALTGEGLYQRRTRTRGVFPWEPPEKPERFFK